MPIYGYGLISTPWVLCNEMSKLKLNKMMKLFKDVELHCGMQESFRHSIIYNIDPKICYIADYDSTKTNMDEFAYQKSMEDLINMANKELFKNRKFENYKFDVMGSFTIGKIVIMEKK